MKFGKVLSLLVVAGALAISPFQSSALAETQIADNSPGLRQTPGETDYTFGKLVFAVEAADRDIECLVIDAPAGVVHSVSAESDASVGWIGASSPIQERVAPPGMTGIRYSRSSITNNQAEYLPGHLMPAAPLYVLVNTGARSQAVLFQRIC